MEPDLPPRDYAPKVAEHIGATVVAAMQGTEPAPSTVASASAPLGDAPPEQSPQTNWFLRYIPDRKAMTAFVASAVVLAGGAYAITYQPKPTDRQESVQLAGVQITQADKTVARKDLVAAANSQKIAVIIDGTTYTFGDKDLGVQRDVDPLLDATYAPPSSVLSRLRDKPSAAPTLVTYVSKKRLQAAIAAKLGSYQASQDASLNVDGDSLVVQPAKAGMQIDFDQAAQQLARSDMRSNLTLTLQYIKHEPVISTAAASKAKDQAESLLNLPYSVSANTGVTKVASRAQKISWLAIEPHAETGDIKIALNADAAKTTLSQLAASFNQDPKDKTVLTFNDAPPTVVDQGQDGVRVDTASVAQGLSGLQAAVKNGQGYTLPVTLATAPAGERDLGTADSGKFVLVDKAKFTSYAIDHGQIVRTMLVSTGIATMPTPTGHFKILRKTPLVTMRGCAPAVGCWVVPNVPNAEFFTDEGHALHGAYWHHDFGKINHSHGCVNLSLDDAAWLYGWTDVGTDVVIM